MAFCWCIDLPSCLLFKHITGAFLFQKDQFLIRFAWFWFNSKFLWISRKLRFITEMNNIFLWKLILLDFYKNILLFYLILVSCQNIYISGTQAIVPIQQSYAPQIYRRTLAVDSFPGLKFFFNLIFFLFGFF